MHPRARKAGPRKSTYALDAKINTQRAFVREHQLIKNHVAQLHQWGPLYCGAITMTGILYTGACFLVALTAVLGPWSKRLGARSTRRGSNRMVRLKVISRFFFSRLRALTILLVLLEHTGEEPTRDKVSIIRATRRFSQWITIMKTLTGYFRLGTQGRKSQLL